MDYEKMRAGDKSKFDGYFQHENRFIRYYSYPVDGQKRVTVYLDEELRKGEAGDYLNRIESKAINYTIEKSHEKRPAFGTVALIENTGQQPSSVYIFPPKYFSCFSVSFANNEIDESLPQSTGSNPYPYMVFQTSNAV